MASNAEITRAAQTIAFFLSGKKYAVVGGAALAILGSSRVTQDVDIVVPQGKTRETRDALKEQSDYFEVDSRTRHTYYKNDLHTEIEILTPPSLFRQAFDNSTPTIHVKGVEILTPHLILNAKCGSVLGRATEEKKMSDAADIKYLLRWMAANGYQFNLADVPNASSEFVQWFIAKNGNSEYWRSVGYEV